MLAQIPFSIQRPDPFSNAAADFVAKVGQRIYVFGGMSGSEVAQSLSDQSDPINVIAAYLVLTGYENPGLDFVCDFNREIDVSGASDIEEVYRYIYDKYLGQPKFLEKSADTVRRLTNALASGAGVGVDLFIYRITDLMNKPMADQVNLSSALRRQKSCVTKSDTGITVLKISAMGILAIIGFMSLRKIFK